MAWSRPAGSRRSCPTGSPTGGCTGCWTRSTKFTVPTRRRWATGPTLAVPAPGASARRTSEPAPPPGGSTRLGHHVSAASQGGGRRLRARMRGASSVPGKSAGNRHSRLVFRDQAVRRFAMKTEKTGNGTLEHWTAEEVSEAFARNEVAIVDVRTPQEYMLEHIPGALLMPMNDFDPE